MLSREITMKAANRKKEKAPEESSRAFPIKFFAIFNLQFSIFNFQFSICIGHWPLANFAGY